MGCKKEEITVYEIPKGTESLMALATPGRAATGGKPINYETPAGWKEIAPDRMSIVKFSVAGGKAESSVMSFPGEGASQLDLVNIVRQTYGLGPLSGDELSKLVSPVEVGGEKGSLIDLGSATKSSNTASSNNVMLTVLGHGGVTWFFKLVSAPEVFVTEKTKWLEFLKSVSFTGGAGEAPAEMASGSGMATATEQVAPALENGNAALPKWDVPASWKETAPSAMLLAKFVISGGDGEAAMTVSQLSGDGGGPLKNINRWRGQIGLAPVAASELEQAFTSLDVAGGKAMLVDVSGHSNNGKAARVIAVIWPRNGETWFYKMMGDAAVAGREKDAFLKFIQSVRYPNA